MLILPKCYRRDCFLGALGALLMLVGDLCLSVIPAHPGDSGLFLREVYLNGSYSAWQLPLLLATGFAGMALGFFSVRACYTQIQPQYDRLSPALLIPYGGMVLFLLCSAWAVFTKKTFLPRKMFFFHLPIWQLVFIMIPDIRQALGAKVSTWDFVLSQGSGNAALLIWMLANALWAGRQNKKEAI